MLKFLYFSSVLEYDLDQNMVLVHDPTGLFYENGHPRLNLVVELYVLADKYDIPRLREYCKLAFNKILRRTPILSCLDHIERIFHSTPESDRALRDPCLAWVEEWCIGRAPEVREKFEDVVRDVPQFAGDLALRYMFRHSDRFPQCLSHLLGDKSRTGRERGEG